MKPLVWNGLRGLCRVTFHAQLSPVPSPLPRIGVGQEKALQRRTVYRCVVPCPSDRRDVHQGAVTIGWTCGKGKGKRLFSWYFCLGCSGRRLVGAATKSRLARALDRRRLHGFRSNPWEEWVASRSIPSGTAPHATVPSHSKKLRVERPRRLAPLSSA